MRRAPILLALGLCLGPAGAFAHNYLAPPAPGAVTIIPDIGVSRAAYRELEAADQVDVYEFAAKAGQDIYVQMTVPVLERLRGFAPEFMLAWIGPAPGASAGGEPAPAMVDPTGELPPVWAAGAIERGRLATVDHRVLDALRPSAAGDAGPESEPAGSGSFEGAVALAYDGSADLVFDEPFTGTQYWTRQTATWKAPADGTYRIAVYSRDGRVGKYVLAPGTREAFGIGDVCSLPAVRWEVRTFMEQPVWPDALAYALLLAGLVAAGVLLFVP